MVLMGLGLAGLFAGGAVVLFHPAVSTQLQQAFGSGGARSQAQLTLFMAAAAALLLVILAMLHRLRRVVRTVERGEPFHPRNPTDLRLIALLLVFVEVGSMVVHFAVPARFGSGGGFDDIDFTSWFAVLIILILAEVFREGARLRAEAELTV